jgi:glycerol-3-phosphate dehydrogenase
VQRSLRQDITPAKTQDYCLAGSEGYTPDYAKNLTSLYAIPEATAQHLAVKFGTRATNLLEFTREDSSLGEAIVPGESPIRAEIIYAVREEMAMTIEDVLSRRTGLQLLSWRAARDAAPATGALLARELGWNAEQERGDVQAYEAKITRMLELAGLPDRQHTGEVLGSEPS